MRTSKLYSVYFIYSRYRYGIVFTILSIQLITLGLRIHIGFRIQIEIEDSHWNSGFNLGLKIHIGNGIQDSHWDSGFTLTFTIYIGIQD